MTWPLDRPDCNSEDDPKADRKEGCAEVVDDCPTANTPRSSVKKINFLILIFFYKL